VETGNPPEDDDFLRDDRELVRARIDAADDTAQINHDGDEVPKVYEV
jgi:hypothetical protein